jgi:hypothetical protein
MGASLELMKQQKETVGMNVGRLRGGVFYYPNPGSPRVAADAKHAGS